MNAEQIIQSLKKYVKTYFSISIGIFLFILFFEPFSAVEFDYENSLLFVSGFGAILFVFMVLIHLAFYKTFNTFEEDGNDASLQFYLFNFILICLSSVAFVFYMRYVGKVEITFNIVVKTVVICFSPAIVLNVKNTVQILTAKYTGLLREVRELQEKYKQFSENYSDEVIELKSENESDNYKMLVSDIIFVKSADNYVEVGYKEAGEYKKALIRNTLKNIEAQLRVYNNFVRTHRTGLVNINFVEKLNKNYNVYWLSLSESEETIPVSRQYLQIVKELL